MRILNVLIGLVIFLLGFVAALCLSYNSSFEKPSLLGTEKDSISPPDYLGEDNIFVYPDRVVLRITGASISNYGSTGSMKPVLDSDSNGIRIKPNSESQIKVGSIVTFKRGNELIVHRVIDKGEDNEGIYFITKGDNNEFSDGKIRFSEIEYITVGILY